MSFKIAIDGPSGAGKGSIANLLSKKIKFRNIDTGAAYRCVALLVIDNNIDVEKLLKKDKIELDKILKLVENMDLKYISEKNEMKILLNNEDVSKRIREEKIALFVSKISSINEIREELNKLFRELGENDNIVMEGRDIGSVVFPDADIKIYLDASVEKRAERRYKQNQQMGIESTKEEVIKNIEQRDKKDREKEFGALKQCSDAIYIDGSDLTIKQTVNQIIKIINKKKKDKEFYEKAYTITENNKRKKIANKIIRILLKIFYKLFFRIKVIGKENLPKDKGIILCANHLSLLDPTAIMVLSDNDKITFVAKIEIYRNSILNWGSHVLDVIPIKRGKIDLKSLKLCLKALKENKVVGIFPEGTRKGLNKNKKVKNGAVFLADKAGVDIIPVGIKGDFKIFSKIIIKYGKPIDIQKYKDEDSEWIDRATEEVMNEVIKLSK